MKTKAPLTHKAKKAAKRFFARKATFNPSVYQRRF